MPHGARAIDEMPKIGRWKLDRHTRTMPAAAMTKGRSFGHGDLPVGRQGRETHTTKIYEATVHILEKST